MFPERTFSTRSPTERAHFLTAFPMSPPGARFYKATVITAPPTFRDPTRVPPHVAREGEAYTSPSTIVGEHARPFARPLKYSCTILHTFPDKGNVCVS